MEQENSLIPEEEIKNPEILETSTNDEPVVAESKAVENAKEKKEVPEKDGGPHHRGSTTALLVLRNIRITIRNWTMVRKKESVFRRCAARCLSSALR